MPRARKFSRAVRRATRSALLLLVLLDLGAVVGVFLVTGNTVRQEIEGRIDDEIVFLERILRQGGVGALARVITQPEAGDESGSAIAGLFTPDGDWIAGDLRVLPPFWDQGRFAYQPPGNREASTYFARVVRSGDVLIAVGRSDRVLTWTETVLLPLLLITSTAGVFVIVLFMRQADRELGDDLDRLDAALSRYVGGDEGARVPLDDGGGRDSLHEIGSKINANLDTLTDAMATLRNTTAAVAHDLRRPLVRASLAVEAAAGDPALPPDSADRLALAAAELADLNRTFETILRITALAHAPTAGFGPVDLADLLREMAETFEPLFEDAGGGVDTALPPGPLPIRGDRAMLAQAVVNLVGNALRHAPPGTRLRLSAGRGPDGGAWAEVADDGPGVPEEALAAIFRPFERLDPSRQKEGAGLGLALVAAVARAHGAAVAARNLGPGLAIRFGFPPAPAPAPAAGPAAASKLALS